MAKKSDSNSKKKKSNFTMVRIRRNILDIARTRADQEDRSVANYIARLIKQDARSRGLISE